MIEPLGKQVLIKRTLQEEVGGIMLPGSSFKKMTLTVEDIGPDVLSVQPGDRIVCLPTDCMFFSGYAGLNEHIGFVEEDKIKGVIKDDK